MLGGLVRWLRSRQPLFWIVSVTSAVCFLIIFLSEPYTHYEWPARWGNALGAGAAFGGIALLIGRLIRRRFLHSLRDPSKLFRSPPIGQTEKLIMSSSRLPEDHNRLEITPTTFGGSRNKLLDDMGAFRLHPWVYRAACDLWQGGHYRQAVEQTARAVSRHTQEKVRRYNLSDDKLILNVFSDDDPKPDTPRLRFPGDRNTESWQNRMRGVRAFSQGCFAGIRNIAAHEYELAWSRDLCLEYLAAFSILARWIDESEVYRVN